MGRRSICRRSAILMRFAAKYAGVAYRDFCLRPECKTAAMIACARDFGLDWVTVLSDPYSEARAFGLEVRYPEDSLPQNTTPLIRDIEMASTVLSFRVRGEAGVC